MSTERIAARDVSFKAGEATLLDGVDVSVSSGEFVVVAGPNGAGKTTLLRILAGEIQPSGGAVLLNGRHIDQIKPIDQARARAVLPQQARVEFGFRAREIVAMGRSPWRGRPESDDDDAVIDRCCAEVDGSHLADRVFLTLSGGEMSRITLARVLAQSTPVLLLDEPTAALDLRHQEMVLDAARARVADGGCVVAVLHDLNAAAAHADRIVLLRNGRVVIDGPPRDVLRADLLSEIYEHPIDVFEVPGRSAPIVVPAVRSPTVAEEAPRD